MSEENRYLINRIHKRMTTTGKTVVDLYGDPRLKYPVLTLFNLNELNVVGIDANTLPDGADHYARFFAYWEESKKPNSEGNPYKDVLYLEPTRAPVADSGDDKILAALRIIYKEIEQIRIAVQSIQAGKVATPPQANTPKPATPAEPPLPELPENEARDLFYALAGPAIADKRITAMDVNELTQIANGDGWNTAVAQLQKKLKGRK